MSVGSATRSEFAKYFSTATWWVLALIMVLYLVMLAGGFAAAVGLAQSGSLSEAPDAAVLAAATPTLIYGLAANIGYIFPLLLGILLVTTEFRHRTLVPTFLATPRRGSVLVAKLLTAAVLGAALGVVAVGATAGAGAGTFVALGQEPHLTDTNNLLMFARIVLSFALWAIIGVGVGSILRNQVAAIVAALAFTQFVEPIVRVAAVYAPAVEPATKYLPGAASDTLTGSNYYGLVSTGPAAQAQEWWVGAIILATYAVVLTVVGAATTWRRDVV